MASKNKFDLARLVEAQAAAPKAADIFKHSLGGSRGGEGLRGSEQSFAERLPALSTELRATLAPGDRITGRTQTPRIIKTPEALGLLVRQARETMKLSQTAFADVAGVGRRFVSELENGKPTLELGKVMAVCSAAGLDLMAAFR